MYGIVEAAHLLGDAETATVAAELLGPFARLPMVASLGVACFGSARHTLGVAELTAGDAQRAVEHLRAAVQDNLAMGHWRPRCCRARGGRRRWRSGRGRGRRRGGPAAGDRHGRGGRAGHGPARWEGAARRGRRRRGRRAAGTGGMPA
nr:hypothetical protein GCM10020093_043850 [Planobispora longispora]